jgi:hypothetical protein
MPTDSRILNSIVNPFDSNCYEHAINGGTTGLTLRAKAYVVRICPLACFAANGFR